MHLQLAGQYDGLLKADRAGGLPSARLASKHLSDITRGHNDASRRPQHIPHANTVKPIQLLDLPGFVRVMTYKETTQ